MHGIFLRLHCFFMLSICFHKIWIILCVFISFMCFPTLPDVLHCKWKSKRKIGVESLESQFSLVSLVSLLSLLIAFGAHPLPKAFFICDRCKHPISFKRRLSCFDIDNYLKGVFDIMSYSFPNTSSFNSIVVCFFKISILQASSMVYFPDNLILQAWISQLQYHFIEKAHMYNNQIF